MRVVSSGKATLLELQTRYTIDDLADLSELIDIEIETEERWRKIHSKLPRGTRPS